MPRLFIGISCSRQKYLAQLQSQLKQILTGSKVTWVDPINFHITLKFLGDVEEQSANRIVLILKDIAQKHVANMLLPDRLGTFGPKHEPRVIWFGYQPDRHLNETQSDIDNELTNMGFVAETKKFTPHLTLGRIKKISEKVDLEGFLGNHQVKSVEKLPVNSFQLFESILRKEGPEYRVIKSFDLKEARN
jgi:RNA 2',3'-cyclic 3'-phosphodiesterase